MATGVKTGGRLVGSKNKRIPLLELINSEYPNYHPVLAMCKIAHSIEASQEQIFQAHKEVARYVCPQLKAIDVNIEPSLTVNNPISIKLPNGQTIFI